eukprot:scaffold2879_cov269-Prasinococcus_capsulatus_cf.AAC.16
MIARQSCCTTRPASAAFIRMAGTYRLHPPAECVSAQCPTPVRGLLGWMNSAATLHCMQTPARPRTWTDSCAGVAKFSQGAKCARPANIPVPGDPC